MTDLNIQRHFDVAATSDTDADATETQEWRDAWTSSRAWRAASAWAGCPS
jgi:hypothetical protein